MSTRTRITLTFPNGAVSYGARAVKTLLILTHPYSPSVALKKILPAISGQQKREKLMQIAQLLPVGYTLTLFQEPRRTRKNRSLYWQHKDNNTQYHIGGIA